MEEDLKSIARSYWELRTQAMLNVKKMEECSLKLFTGFLEYAKSRRDEGLGFPELLEGFFSEELDLNSEEDRQIRLSLAKRFYSLARKRLRNDEQGSLLPYLGDF